MNAQNEQIALVTGATGFIGGHLVRKLIQQGWNVHVVVRPESSQELLAELHDMVKIHIHDGTTGGLLAILSEVTPGTVYHLASLFLSEHRSTDIEQLINSNLLFATQLAEAMVQTGVWQLINTGTSWQHFQGRDYSPVNLYAATKQAFEAILAYYVDTTPLRVITLKLFDTYGPGDRRQKLIHLLRQVAERQEPLAMSPGDQLIDLVHIDDVVQAYISAADLLHQERITGHESFAVSSGAAIRLKDLVTLYGRLMGRSLPIQWGGRPYRSREVMTPWQTGLALPGWKPQVSLEDGLRQLVAEAEGKTSEGCR
jgi:nucleoside-diphosphate-sugar epimerase